jgi:hypothetical protein
MAHCISVPTSVHDYTHGQSYGVACTGCCFPTAINLSSLTMSSQTTLESGPDALSVELNDRAAPGSSHAADSAEIEVLPVSKRKQAIVLVSSFLTVFLTIGR